MLNAMIFAAGLGTRLRPFTNDRPKALVDLEGQTLLERAIRKLALLKVDRIVINIHHFGEQIIDFMNVNDNFGLDIRISDERDELLDTGGGLKKAASLFIPDAPVLIYNVDVFSDMDLNVLVRNHQEKKALATLAVRKRETSRYLVFDSNFQLCGWKNVTTGEVKEARPIPAAAKEFAFNGVHVVSPEIFSLINEEGKFSIIDLYLRLAADHPVYAFHDQSEVWIDLGKPNQLKMAADRIRK
ncbi:MAG: nucleotidyltransferase family protein [Marinifilaceae bacterium]